MVSPTKRPEGRTYADYESVNECMEGKRTGLHWLRRLQPQHQLPCLPRHKSGHLLKAGVSPTHKPSFM
uniref:Enhancer of rudimentary homolog n=1 Tax=Gouania willdenowi TaxID=441366 RepID=A0A8C5DFR6_GOUWI